MEIKTAIIISVIACVLCSISAVGITYKYTSQHYELQIAEEHLMQQTALTKANEKVIIAERKNNETTELLNRKALDQDKIINGLQNQLANLRTVNNGLRIQSKCISSPTTTPDSTSNDFNSTTTRTTEGVCELPAMFADTITETARAADELRSRAIICQEYTESIIEQRKNISNDNKQQ